MNALSAMKAIIQREGKILLIAQNFGSDILWDLPGGKVEGFETPYETLCREVKEEVCLDIDTFTLFGLFWFQTKKYDCLVVCTTFLCTATGQIDLSQNPAAEDIVEYRWVRPEEAVSAAYMYGDESLRELLKRLL